MSEYEPRGSGLGYSLALDDAKRQNFKHEGCIEMATIMMIYKALSTRAVKSRLLLLKTELTNTPATGFERRL